MRASPHLRSIRLDENHNQEGPSFPEMHSMCTGGTSDWIGMELERETGLEPATSSLGS